LISKKMDKEANRYIQQWPDEKISIENGRWGPYIRFGKKMLKLGRKANGEKYTAEELGKISVDEVKNMIEEQVPGAFTKKVAAKKAATKKAAPKKSVKKKPPKKK
jgi:DNA topoisomerase I